MDPVSYTHLTDQNGNSLSGVYDPATGLFSVTGEDLRSADAYGNVLYTVAPTGWPTSIRVDACLLYTSRCV